MQITILSKITLLSLLLYPSLLPMHKTIKRAGGLIVVSGLGHHYYKQKRSFNDYYENKELVYLTDLELVTPVKKVPLRDYASTKADCAPTYNHITALHHATWPDKSQHESLDTKIEDILTEYYPDGLWQLPEKTKRELSSAIKATISNEIHSSGTHYSVYHGTDNTTGILFRTILHQTKYPHTPQEYLVLRDPDITNPFENDSDPLTVLTAVLKEKKSKLWKEYDENFGPNGSEYLTGKVFGSSRLEQDAINNINRTTLPSHYNDALLSINRAALANSSPKNVKGSNSLRFLTAIQRYNNIENSLFISHDDLIDPEAHINEIKKTVQSYGGDPRIIDTYINELKPLCTHIGGTLIHIKIPKSLSATIMNSASYNNPRSYAQKKLEEIQAPLKNSSINAIDHGHMIVPIPSVLNTPTNGVRMHTIINANQKDLKAFINICHKISEEIVHNKNQ